MNDLPYPVDEVVAAIEEHGLEVRASDRPATTDAILRLRYGVEVETFRVAVRTRPSAAAVALLGVVAAIPVRSSPCWSART